MQMKNGCTGLRYRQFACPQEPHVEQVFETIAVVHSRAIVEIFVAEHRAAIARRSQGLIELLEGWLRSNTDFDTIWDLAFGRAYWALESRSLDPLDIATRLALRIMATGRPGGWSAALDDLMELRWDRWLLPAGRRIDVESDGSVARIHLQIAEGSHRQITFTHGESGWMAEDLEPLLQVGVCQRFTLLPGHAVPSDLADDRGSSGMVGVRSIEPAMFTAFSKGVQVLADQAPLYLEWVERVLRSIVVWQCDPTRTRSKSSMDAPGIIFASFSSSPIAIAEMLVHEATHQYFHLLCRLGPLADGTDESQYYSPPVGTNRPLSRILIAYHAFANVLLFYRTCISNGIDDGGYCARGETRLCQDLEVLEAPLCGNPALTALGRALCQPLIERLH